MASLSLHVLCGVQGDIIAEICDVDNQSLVNIVGLGKVTAVVSKDTVGRLMVLCARQPGLSAVWEALLGTDGEQDCWSCIRACQSGCSQGGTVAHRPLDQSAWQEHVLCRFQPGLCEKGE